VQGEFRLMPEQASTIASRVDGLYYFLAILTIFVSFAIAAVIIYYVIRYRRRDQREIGAQIEGSLKLETIWIVIPFIIAMIIFFWGAAVYFADTNPPREAMEITVVAKQWMWKFQHPEGLREINELHVPVDRDVKVTMATEDVIHSFFVPAFRIKTDVIPGRYTSTWFRATKPGRYHLFCAEYCGTNHSAMIGWIVVMEPAEYQAWLSGGPAEGSLADRGGKLFQDLACNTCHRSDARGRGPVLVGLYGKPVVLDNGQTVIADDAYLRESILNPQAKIVAGFQRPSIMPSFQGLLSEEQVLELIAYIKSLGTPGAIAAPLAPLTAGESSAAPERAVFAGQSVRRRK
jgi:cytochrome c oxidase subunit 2